MFKIILFAQGSLTLSMGRYFYMHLQNLNFWDRISAAGIYSYFDTSVAKVPFLSAVEGYPVGRNSFDMCWLDMICDIHMGFYFYVDLSISVTDLF